MRDAYKLKKSHLKSKIKILEEQLLQQEERVQGLLIELDQLRGKLMAKENEIREIHINYMRSREEYEAEYKRQRRDLMVYLYKNTIGCKNN